MTGIAVVTTRLSNETMNRATEVMANVQIIRERGVVISFLLRLRRAVVFGRE